MSTHHSDILSKRFYDWEVWGRGWFVHGEPIFPEPPFTPFPGHSIVATKPKDDTFRHSISSYILSAIKNRIVGKPGDNSEEEQSVALPKIFPVVEELTELVMAIPPDFTVSPSVMEQFLVMIASTKSPVSFEIVGTHQHIFFQFTCRLSEAGYVRSQLKAFFPQVVVQVADGSLYGALAREECLSVTLELGLTEEFMRPINMPTQLDVDPYTAIVGILDDLDEHEVAAIQILFHGTERPWADSVIRSVTTSRGEPFFLDAPEMTTLAKEKVSQPLMAVNVRLIAQSRDEAAYDLAALLGNALVAGTERVGSNALQALEADGLEHVKFLTSLIERTTYRTGMILNVRELMGLVHLSGNLPSNKLVQFSKSKRAPEITNIEEYVIGYNPHQGEAHTVGLPLPVRLRHIHLVGATGTGKSTLLVNLILQNILNEPYGGAVLDPHGDLIDDIVAQIPEHLQHKFILIDPSDDLYSIGFNLLSANSEHEKVMLASDLAASFKAQTTSWGDQMDTVLQNAIAAFLESSRGGTLIDLRRFLVDEKFRKQFLTTVTDPLIVSYWEKEFPKLRSGSVSSLLSRMQLFLRPKPVRYMLMQKEGLDFNQVMNDGLILLVKLSQGLIGEENSHLLGSMILTKLYQSALGRQVYDKHERVPFFVYLDEFQNFITPTLEGILSGARKYGLGLVLAHQSMDQLYRRSPAVANSVIANAGTRICFRLGDNDASSLQNSFADFDANDLLSLKIGDAIVRVGTKDQDFNLKTLLPDKVPLATARGRYLSALHISSLTFGTPIRELEEILQREYAGDKADKSSIFEEVDFTEVPDEPEVKPTSKPKPPKEPRFLSAPPQTKTKPVETTTDPETAREEIIKRAKQKAEETEHRSLQMHIKKVAEGMGYLSVMEAPTPDRKGRVDVLLTKDKHTIACEVAVTTTNQHELGNIQKCLTAKYSLVVVVSEKPKRLENIKSLVAKSVSKTAQKRIHYVNKDGFFQLLMELKVKSKSTEKTIKGYRVKSSYKAVSGKDAQRMQEQLADIYMKSKKSKPKK
ncbi:MAG: type IV secretion system DNA-binding domain-containing protein [Bacteroidia bacterium]|nr:type IV secretion system DNA-binding domain-containing protein [Bacteroidia bacterium]